MSRKQRKAAEKSRAGARGGHARAAVLSDDKRREIAKAAALARWSTGRRDPDIDVSTTTADIRRETVARIAPRDEVDSLLGAGILVIPWEGFREYPKPLFPVGTEELVLRLRDELRGTGVDAKVVIPQAGYTEIALHSDILRIATLIVEDGALPLLVGVLANYVTAWIKGRTDTQVKSEVIVEKGDTRVFLKYEGPAETFASSIHARFQMYSTDGASAPHAAQETEPAMEKEGGTE